MHLVSVLVSILQIEASALPATAPSLPPFRDLTLTKITRYAHSSGRTDHMDRWTKADLGSVGYSYQGANWYILSQSNGVPNTNTLYSLFNSYLTDHMTSLNPSESNSYSCETPAGWANTFKFPDPSIGTASIYRWVKYFDATKNWYGATVTPFRYDHITGINGENLAAAGYTREGSLGAGWPTKEIIDPSKLDITYSTQGNLALGASRTWGGAISSIKWKGVEIVNRLDIGRLLQTALFYSPYLNPTEAGDGWGLWAGNRAYENGAPVISFTQDQTSVTSTSLPLYFSNPASGGYTPNSVSMTPDITADNPRMSGDIIEKSHTIIKSAAVGVIKGDVRVTLSRSRSEVPYTHPAGTYPAIEALAFYVTSENFYAFANARWNGVSWDAAGTDDAVYFPNGNPAFMISTNAQNTLAVGVYYRPFNEGWGGYNQYVHAFPVGSANAAWPIHQGPLAWESGKFQIAMNLGQYAKGEKYSFSYYIIVGSSSNDVWAEAIRMAQAGY